MKSSVYFIAVAGRIKIGTTTNLKSRMEAFAAFIPDPIELIGTTPGSYGVEGQFHARFAEFRIKGEWFRDCPALRELIRGIIFYGPPAVGLKPLPTRRRSSGHRERDGREVIDLIERARTVWPRKTAYHLAFATGCSIRASKYWLAGVRIPNGAAAVAIAKAIQSTSRAGQPPLAGTK